RVSRADAVGVERADGLEPAEHAELAVVLAAGGNGVHVRAHYDGRQRLAACAFAEDVAHLIDGDAQPGLAHPAHHQIAAALVVVRQRQPREPAARRGADAPELVDRLLEARAVDPGGRALTHR